MQVVANSDWVGPVAGFCMILGILGAVVFVVADAFVPNWDLAIRAKFPQLTARKRYIVCVLLVFATPIVLLCLRQPLLLIIPIAISLPFAFLIAMARRKT